MNYPVPGYLAPFMLTGMIIVIRALLLGLGRALRRAAWPETDRAKALWSVSSLLVGWFVVAVVSSIAGFYRPPSGNPPTIQYGLLAPIVVGLLLFRIWPLLRRTLATVPSALARWSASLSRSGSDLPGTLRKPTSLGTVRLARRFRRYARRNPRSLRCCELCTFAGRLCAASPPVEPARHY